jgi:hypothetical protein
MAIPAQVPRRRKFNLRTEDPSTAIVTTTSNSSAPKRESKCSRLSRLFHATTSVHHNHAASTTTPDVKQTSPLPNLPDSVLKKILFYTLDTPFSPKVSLNFPCNPVPEGCIFHISYTSPPALFTTCHALRSASQLVFFSHATFNITLLAGGPTAHFY